MAGAGQTQTPPTVERNPPRPTQHIVCPSAATDTTYSVIHRNGADKCGGSAEWAFCRIPAGSVKTVTLSRN